MEKIQLRKSMANAGGILHQHNLGVYGMEGQFDFGGDNKALEAVVRAYVETRYAAKAQAITTRTAEAGTEVLPAEQAFGCRTCRVQFETRSEMAAHFKTQEHLAAKRRAAQRAAGFAESSSDGSESSSEDSDPVSYTHLTLPTIYSV